MPAPATLPRDPPFRAEHLGSLLRPKELLARRQSVDEKKATEADLKPLEDIAIDHAVKLQTDNGFRAITDGEYRRHMFWGTFWVDLEGMTEIYNPGIDIFRTYLPDIAAFMEKEEKPGESVICTGKIKHKGTTTHVDHLQYLQKLIPKERWGEIKLTLPAPEWYHLRYKEGKAYPSNVYASDKEYFADIAKAYQTELDILYKAGLRNVQLDDPNFAYFCSESMLKGWKEDPQNTQSAEELLDAYIELYNDCLSKVPSDMHVGLHICRGNFVNSRHFSEGGYDRIAAKLFRNLEVSTYYLEYDTPRAGGFEPLKELPKNKNVILGVVTSKFPKMEDKEDMKKRVYAAADIVAEGNNETREEALKRLGVSLQCGFASHSGGNLVTHDDMARKLKLVREIANEIWPNEP